MSLALVTKIVDKPKYRCIIIYRIQYVENRGDTYVYRG